jgi:hypothetical protein
MAGETTVWANAVAMAASIAEPEHVSAGQSGQRLRADDHAVHGASTLEESGAGPQLPPTAR